jgi:Mce-associated membrane protein
MAAVADAVNGEMSEKAGTGASPAAPDPADQNAPAYEVESRPTAVADAESAKDDGDDAEDYEAADGDMDSGPDDAAPVQRRSHVRLAMVAGLVIVVAMMATVGWLGFRSHQSHQDKARQQLFLQVGRQCALNLTTIDWQHAEADVQRLLDSATGKFYDQFAQREQPFIDVVKKAQSKSVGTITEAGLQSESGDKADVLVSVSIKTTNLGATDEPPREWRMRISVEKSGGDLKISNVAFVQ